MLLTEPPAVIRGDGSTTSAPDAWVDITPCCPGMLPIVVLTGATPGAEKGASRLGGRCIPGAGLPGADPGDARYGADPKDHGNCPAWVVPGCAVGAATLVAEPVRRSVPFGPERTTVPGVMAPSVTPGTEVAGVVMDDSCAPVTAPIGLARGTAPAAATRGVVASPVVAAATGHVYTGCGALEVPAIVPGAATSMAVDIGGIVRGPDAWEGANNAERDGSGGGGTLALGVLAFVPGTPPVAGLVTSSVPGTVCFIFSVTDSLPC